jgi:amino acid adenylation domain-containing protein
MNLLHHLLTESSVTYPEKTAVAFKDTTITYSSLETKSNQLALMLSKHGITRGDRIGIKLGKSIESIIALFGILKAGAIYVPLDPLAPIAKVNHIITHCGIECIITSAEHLQIFKSGPQSECLPLRSVILTGPKREEEVNPVENVEVISWEEVSGQPGEKHYDVPLSDSDPAYILHTSGSTGTPKGVVISHVNALAFVNMAVDFFKIGENDRIANHAPLHFDLSVFDIFGAIKAGAAIIIVPEFLSTFPSRLAEYIDREQVTIWNSVASVLAMLAAKGRLERFTFSSLRLVHFSGEVMPLKYLRILKKCMPKAEFFNIYGQTEANSSLFYRIDDVIKDNEKKIPIGKPFPHFDVFAIDDSGKVISGTGEEGELHVLSDTVALGYWNDDERTRERFVPDPRGASAQARVYKTGDLVRLDPERNYIFVGRKDHMIKSRGYRIELGEIEVVLNSHPLIRQAAAIAVPDDLIGNRIIAYVALIEGAEFNQRELLEFCAATLVKYMVPEVIEERIVMPINENGKIDRMALVNDFLTKQQVHQYEERQSRMSPPQAV